MPSLRPAPTVTNYATAAAICGFVGGVYLYCTRIAVRQEELTQSDLDDFRARRSEKEKARELARGGRP